MIKGRRALVVLLVIAGLAIAIAWLPRIASLLREHHYQTRLHRHIEQINEIEVAFLDADGLADLLAQDPAVSEELLDAFDRKPNFYYDGMHRLAQVVPSPIDYSGHSGQQIIFYDLAPRHRGSSMASRIKLAWSPRQALVITDISFDADEVRLTATVVAAGSAFECSSRWQTGGLPALGLLPQECK
ncbi:MAG: hypothetical protein ACTS3F_09355 [Phycisphaerales bacterium]